MNISTDNIWKLMDLFLIRAIGKEVNELREPNDNYHALILESVEYKTFKYFFEIGTNEEFNI